MEDFNEILDEVGEETEDELQVDYLKNISDVVTWSTDWTVETIITQIEKGNIDLRPRFQRRDAWNPVKKSRFIESVIYGLPIPQIVLAENKASKGKFIIVDGKQRLLTLYQFCSTQSDKTLILAGLNNSTLNGKNKGKLSLDNEDLYNNFINQSIRSVIIKNWPSDPFLYTIFFRLNTGSLGLSPQELRLALKPGPFMDYAENFSRNDKIKRLLKLDEPDYRMRDVDLVIRYFSFKNILDTYTGNYKDFLDRTCEQLNQNWEVKKTLVEQQSREFEEGIDFSIDVFGENDVLRKWNKGRFENRINRAVFDIMLYYFSDPDLREKLKPKKVDIKEAFVGLCKTNTKFQKSLSSNTNNMIETSTRFYIWWEELSKISGETLPIADNIKQYYEQNA
jgi:hypothetical protein